jgi:hypothetical protein
MRFCSPAVVLCLLAAGCAGTDSGAPRPVADPPIVRSEAETTEESMASAEEAVTFSALLERSLTDPGLRESLDLLTECRGETGMRTMKAWGDGLGVWQGRRQFHLPAKQVVEVLEHLHAADFAAFAPLYGGPKQEDPREHDRPDDGSAILIVCRLRVSLGGQIKESSQRAKGEQSEELRTLAEGLLAIGEKAASNGVEAADLLDGLEKVGRGELDPRVFRVMLHRKPTAEEIGESGPGFLMRVEGQEATTHPHDPESGYGQEKVLDLDVAAVHNLALVVAELDPAGMPVNLWAPVYTEVAIEVLNHRKSVQARPFVGLEPTTHGDLQQSFDALVRTLVRLQDEVAADGVARTD